MIESLGVIAIATTVSVCPRSSEVQQAAPIKLHNFAALSHDEVAIAPLAR
jgi:hypothetical protein